MKDKILAFFKEKQNVLWQTCIILCSFYVAFSNDSFSLNPYFLILLLLLTKNGNIIFIIFSISALILGSFLKSINYGIELSLACFLYLVLLFFPRYKKSYRQLYITNTLYFLAFISIYLLKKSPTSILINFGISYLIVQFFTFYLNSNLCFIHITIKQKQAACPYPPRCLSLFLPQESQPHPALPHERSQWHPGYRSTGNCLYFDSLIPLL